MSPSPPPDASASDGPHIPDVLERERQARAQAGKLMGQAMSLAGEANELTESAATELRETLIRMVNELLETKHFLNNVLDSSTQYSIIAMDLERRVLMWNEGARRNYGYGADEVLGRKSDFLHDPSDLESGFVRDLHEEALQTGQAEGRFLRRRKDGQRFVASVVITRREDAEGHPIGYLLVSRDVSEEEKAKQAVKAADEAKDRFVATMSHEVRTPLSGVLGVATLLQSTPLSDEQKEYVSTIESSGKHLLALLSDVLDLSRLEAGGVSLDPEPALVRHSVEQALDIVAAQADRRGLDLAYLMEDSVPENVLMDATRLRQVLVNFLGNAVKFTEEGEVFLHVDAEEGGRLLRFEVRDTGPGISKEKLGGVFDLFGPGEPGLRQRHGGSGVGLALSRHIVETAGGEVDVSSKPGQGSTFRFSWPVDLTRQEGAWQEENETLRSKRVLVVASGGTQVRLVHQLQAWGMVADAAPSVAEAKKARQTHDIIVVDRGLSDSASFVQQANAPAVTILSLSQALKARGTRSVTKPVKSRDLYAAVLAALGGTPGEPVRPRALDEKVAHRLPLRILVAEDSPVNQTVIMGMLRRLGYDPQLVDNGLDAVEAASGALYDLVLLDLQMPQMDGLEAATRVSQLERPPRLVAMTAYAGREQREACQQAGFSDYLLKPFTPESLMRVLEASALSRLSMLSPTAAHEVVTAFQHDAPETVQRICEAAEAGRFDDVAALAHDLGSAASVVGAGHLMAAAAEIGAQAQAGERVQCRELEESVQEALSMIEAA